MHVSSNHSESALALQPPQSLGDAKGALLEWSAQADAELLAQVQDFVGDMKAKARKAAPWAAGAALLAGLLLGRRRKRRRTMADDAEPVRGSAGGAARLGAIFKIAIALAPHILPLLRRR